MERISLINIEMLSLYKLTCPVHRPTTRSAMKQSSVSPERWDTITPHPAACDILHASILSVTDPIWLTFNNKQLHAFLSIPVRTRLGFVTRRSSLRNRKHLHKFSDTQFRFISVPVFSFFLNFVYLRKNQSSFFTDLIFHGTHPTSWILTAEFILVQASQSSWSNASSMETTGYFSVNSL